MGGNATLASYGVPNASAESPAATRDAFAAAFPPSAHGLPRRLRAQDPRSAATSSSTPASGRGCRSSEQTRDDLIWIREPFLSSEADFGFKVVHGHTIVPQVEHWPNRIAVDTGAVRTGVLSCLVLEGTQVVAARARGPAPLAGGLAGLDGPEPAAHRLAEPLDAALSARRITDDELR